MDKYFDADRKGQMEYFGHSDLLAQVAYELQHNADSCFGKNLIAWYNTLYSANPNDKSCAYQIETLPPSQSVVVNVLKAYPYSTLESIVVEVITAYLNTLSAPARNSAVTKLKSQIK